MKDEFNQDGKRSFESLRAEVQFKYLTYCAFSNPSMKAYERFADSCDVFLDAFREKYASLQDYIDAEEKALLPLLQQKGINQQEPVIDLDEGLQKTIAILNKQVYTKDAYVSRDKFAELFVMRLPAAYESITEQIKKMPDAPKPPVPRTSGPGAG